MRTSKDHKADSQWHPGPGNNCRRPHAQGGRIGPHAHQDRLRRLYSSWLLRTCYTLRPASYRRLSRGSRSRAGRSYRNCSLWASSYRAHLDNRSSTYRFHFPCLLLLPCLTLCPRFSPYNRGHDERFTGKDDKPAEKRAVQECLKCLHAVSLRFSCCAPAPSTYISTELCLQSLKWTKRR